MQKMTTLKDLGITDVMGIKKVKAEHTGSNDILTIYYKRKPFSILSPRKRIIFNRCFRQMLINKQGKQQWKSFSSVSFAFQRALDELHSIIEAPSSKSYLPLKKEKFQKIEMAQSV